MEFGVRLSLKHRTPKTMWHVAAGNQKEHSKVKNNNTMVHDKLFIKCKKNIN